MTYSSEKDLVPFAQFFRHDFLSWLGNNRHIYNEFEKQALALIARGRTHYSARTIVEVLVHHSLLAETNGAFKIGNDRAPDLARAFAVRHPDHATFWEYRRDDWREFLDALGICAPVHAPKKGVSRPASVSR